MNSESQGFTVLLSVGGMTCAACANTIQDTLLHLPGVTDVLVNVIEGSAKATIPSRDDADIVREAIEASGYEAQIAEVNSIRRRQEDEARVASLQINGMQSLDCLQKVQGVLEGFGSDLKIIKPLETLEDPIVTISYHPTHPHMTIRTIIASLSAIEPSLLEVSVYHSPSIEALNRKHQAIERTRLLHRFFFSLIAAIPTFIIGIVYATLVKDGNPTKAYLAEPMWSGSVSRMDWAMFIIATPVMFYGCGTFHGKSIQEIYSMWRKGSHTPFLQRFTRFGSMNLLVSLGVSVAYFSSVAILALAATIEEKESLGDGYTTYFDTVVFLTVFLLAGRYLEAYSRLRTSDAITALSMLRPSEALLLDSTSDEQLAKIETANSGMPSNVKAEPRLAGLPPNVEKIPVDLLEVGDTICIPSGASPPADGTILSGYRGVFDESSLTGESRLISKKSGDNVFVGTINKGQIIRMKVGAIGTRTVLDQIVLAVREGQARHAPIERIADLITGYFVPAITFLALLVWIIWISLGLSGALPPDYLDSKLGGWPLWSLQFAIAVFVVACPCGIGLAAPTALLVGLGLAANHGILARGGGEAFQEMSQLDTIVFDKTGTITRGGEPRVSDSEFLLQDRLDRAVVLGIASELESISSHPLGIAIRNFSRDQPAQKGSDFEEVAGRGIKGNFPHLACRAVIGNEKWMEEHQVHIEDVLKQRLDIWKNKAKSVVLLAISFSGEAEYHIAAMFAISDPIRPEASSVVSQLRSLGIDIWLLSGDNSTTALAVAKSVGIPANQVISGVLPHEKSDWIQRLQRQNMTPTGNAPRKVVAMVGDGINDAPALAVADVGIAIGSGSDVALSSASFVLLSSDLRSVIALRNLSKRVIHRIRFNFVWAIMYNMIAVPIAAGVLYPAGHIRLNPVWASLAMALSSLTVVMSSLLLRVGGKRNY